MEPFAEVDVSTASAQQRTGVQRSVDAQSDL